jgi:heme/copper-type cytochrome/quinol oxidase subunit 3
VRGPTLDVSGLPGHAFGTRTDTFLATAMAMVVEGTFTALLLVGYFYIRARVDPWPPIPPGREAFHWATASVACLAASAVPSVMCGYAAADGNVPRTRWLLFFAVLLGAGFVVTRFVELGTLDFRWDDNAHASLFFTLQGFHLLLALFDFFESVFFLVLLLRGPIEKKKLADLDSDATFWVFVVLSGLGQFFLLYFDGRAPYP